MKEKLNIVVAIKRLRNRCAEQQKSIEVLEMAVAIFGSRNRDLSEKNRELQKQFNFLKQQFDNLREDNKTLATLNNQFKSQLNKLYGDDRGKQPTCIQSK